MKKGWFILDLAKLSKTDEEYIYGIFETKKQAEEQVKRWRWIDKLENVKSNYIVVQENELF